MSYVFVQALKASAGCYASAEAANVAALTAIPAQTLEQQLPGVINAPFLGLTGRPLIGTGAIGNGFAFVQQEIQRTATTLATGFTQVGNTLATDIFGSPAISPVPATQHPAFTGTQSLLTKLETAALRPRRAFLTVSGIYDQFGEPGSPVLEPICQRPPSAACLVSRSQIVPLAG